MGNLGRNTLTLPGTTNVDFTLMKDTPLGGENVSLQFRAEFFGTSSNVDFNLIERCSSTGPTSVCLMLVCLTGEEGTRSAQQKLKTPEPLRGKCSSP